MWNGDEERSSEADGWRQVKDYCQRFGRDHLHQYLVPLHGADVPRSNMPRPKFEDDMNEPNMKSADVSFENEKKSDGFPSAKTESNRDESPESAKALKKLEWDSLADIGYGCNQGKIDKPLSTIERIALKQHYETEFTIHMKSPTAQSTPNLTQSQSDNASSSSIFTKSKSYSNLSHTKNKNIAKPKTLNLSIEIEEGVSSIKLINQPSSNTKDKLIDSSRQVKNSESKHIDEFKTPQGISRTDVSDETIKEEFDQHSIKNKHIGATENIVFDVVSQSPKEQNIPIEIVNADLFENTSIVNDSASGKYDNDFTNADSFEYMPAFENISSSPNVIENETPLISSKTISNIVSPDLVECSGSNKTDAESNSCPSDQNSLYVAIDKIVNSNYDDTNYDKKEMIDRMIKALFKKNYSESEINLGFIKEFFDKNFSLPSSPNLELKQDLKQMKSAYTMVEIDTSEKTPVREIGVNTETESVAIKTDVPERIPKSQHNESSQSESNIVKTNRKMDYTILSDNSEETKSQLENINREISNLLRLKMKLESGKYSKRKSIGCNTDFKKGTSTISTISSFSKSYISSSHESTKTPNENKFNINVPLLNLKSSSDESSNKRKNKSSKYSKTSKLKSGSGIHDESSKSGESNGCKHDSKIEGIESNNNIDSASTSTSHIKNDLNSKIIEMQKVCEKLSKYKSCKVLKSFLKEYGDLVKKYMELKKGESEAQYSGIKRMTDTVQLVDLSKSTSSKESTSYANIKSSGGKITIRNRDLKSSKVETENCYDSMKFQNTKQSSKSDYIDDSKSSKSKFPTTSLSLQISSDTKVSTSSCANKTQSYSKLELARMSANLNALLKEMRERMDKYEDQLKNLEKIDRETEKRSMKTSKTTILADSLSKNENKTSKTDKLSNVVYEQPPRISNRNSEEKSIILDDSSHINSQASQFSIERTRSCNCQKKKTQYKSPVGEKSSKQKISLKKYPKSIAYELILEPSDSVLDKTPVESKREPLERVIVKIPFDGQMRNNQKNEPEALCKSRNSFSNPKRQTEEIGYSTDEQLKEFSSLTDDRLNVEECKAPQKNNNKNKRNALTVEEYLLKNRPAFVHNLKERQNFLKEFNKMRNMLEKKRRIALETGLADISNYKNISESNLRALINLKDYQCPARIKNTLFNTREIVKRTAVQYRKLPEMVNKKELVKKQATKRTNRLMADLFVKNLRRKTLRGVVNISHRSNIISI